jgi:hypothetical protein
MKFNQQYNSRAIEIWRQFNSLHQRVPLLIPDCHADLDMLIIGMNPSFRVDEISKQIATIESLKKYTTDQLFNWNDGELIEERLDHLVEWESHVLRTDRQYYKQICGFVNDCGFTRWAHIDLFLMRETNQKLALNVVGYNDSNGSLNDFGSAQVELCLDAIRLSKAKLVLVANAAASTILLRAISKSTHSVTRIDDMGMPIYFAGMLSGQRALDRFSKQRLIDQIRYDQVAN